MKNILILLFIAIGLSSCSKDTLSNIERDTAQNIIRINKWYDVVKTVSAADAVDVIDTLVGSDSQNNYMEFRANNNAYIMHGDKWSDPIPYELKGDKIMVFDGVEYQIKENIISTVAKFTLVREDAGVTTTIAFRRR